MTSRFVEYISFLSAQCDQPIERGVFNGSFDRWGYDKEKEACVLFSYGECKANKNNFPTESSCNWHCSKADVDKSE